MSWEDAPVEVITQIFSFLESLEDRQSSSLVCQKWYQAYRVPKFRDLEKVTVSKQDHFSQLLELPNKEFQIRNLQVMDTEVGSKHSLPFWSRYGSFVQCLRISTSYVTDVVMVQIMSHCPNLKTLSLIDCLLFKECLEVKDFEELLSNVPKPIEHLNIVDNFDLTNTMFSKLLSSTPNLKSLKLSVCTVILELDATQNLQPKREQQEKLKTLLNFDTVCQCLSTTKHIVDLNLCKSSISADHLKLICSVPSIKLTSLNLSGCRGLSEDAIRVMATNQTSLMHLNFSNCVNWMTDECLKCIGTLSDLKNLNVENCNISDQGIVELWNLDLISLNILGCMEVTGRGLFRALGQRPNYNLKNLQMGKLVSVDENNLINVIRNAPNLRYLDLNHCSMGVSDNTLQTIIRTCPHLEVLLTGFCRDITDRGITGNDATRAENETNDANLPPVAECNGVNLKSLKNLKELSFIKCVHITDESLFLSFEFTDLIKLDLSGCKEITHEGIKHLTEKNPAIEELKLRICNRIEDEGVLYIMKNLTRLTSLSVGSRRITTECLTYFEQYGNNLTDLDIMHCVFIDVEVAEELKYKLKSLKRYRCPNQVYGSVASQWICSSSGWVAHWLNDEANLSP